MIRVNQRLAAEIDELVFVPLRVVGTAVADLSVHDDCPVVSHVPVDDFDLRKPSFERPSTAHAFSGLS